MPERSDRLGENEIRDSDVVVGRLELWRASRCFWSTKATMGNRLPTQVTSSEKFI